VHPNPAGHTLIAAFAAHLITERLLAAQSVLVHAQKVPETSRMRSRTETTEVWYGRAREQGRQGRVRPLQQLMQQRQHGGESYRSELNIEPDEPEPHPQLTDDGAG